MDTQGVHLCGGHRGTLHRYVVVWKQDNRMAHRRPTSPLRTIRCYATCPCLLYPPKTMIQWTWYVALRCSIDQFVHWKCTFSFLIQLINEVTDRLRKNPHLPLVVMPTLTPGSPPLIFQPSSSDAIFVGLPATIGRNGVERPRLVTSPADRSAFVVASKRIPNNSTEIRPNNFPRSRADLLRFTISAPHPGSILGVSPEGDLYEFKSSSWKTVPIYLLN